MSDFVFNVVIDGFGGYGRVRRAEVLEGFGKHDVVLVDFPYGNAFTAVAPERTPVRITWSRSRGDTLRQFQGYVNHTERITPERGGTAEYGLLRFVLIGTSQPLNRVNPRSWTDTTGSAIVKSIAHDHRLRAVVTKSSRRIPYWATGKDTDFLSIKALAERDGNRVWVSGGTIFYIDPNVLVRYPVDTPYSFVANGTSRDTLISHGKVTGSMVPGTAASKTALVYGIDGSTGTLLHQTSDAERQRLGLPAAGYSEVYPLAVGSFREAREAVESRVNTGNWSTLTARLALSGSIKTGRLVNLGGAIVTEDVQGDWLVSSASHVFDAADTSGRVLMYSDVELTRNNTAGLTYRNQRNLSGALEEVPAVIRSNNKWESSVLESVNV